MPDDPLFDPWGVEAEEPDAPRIPPRWKTPSRHVPKPPVKRGGGAAAQAPPSPEPASPPERHVRAAGSAPLGGIAGFLRKTAVPRLRRVAARLQLAGHEASVHDRLDEAQPMVRLEARWQGGPWSAEEGSAAGVLELSPAQGALMARSWITREGAEPHAETSVPTSKLEAGTIERLALALLQELAERA